MSPVLERVERHPTRTRAAGNWLQFFGAVLSAALCFRRGARRSRRSLSCRCTSTQYFFRALVQIVERVEQAIFDMQRDGGDRRGATAVSWGRRSPQRTGRASGCRQLDHRLPPPGFRTSSLRRATGLCRGVGEDRPSLEEE